MENTVLRCPEIVPYSHQNSKLKQYMQSIVSNKSNQKCECCPYGHHVNVDFVEFAKDLSDSQNEVEKVRRCQRKFDVKPISKSESFNVVNNTQSSVELLNSNEWNISTRDNVFLSNNSDKPPSNVESQIFDNNEKFSKRIDLDSSSNYSSVNSKSYVVSYEHLMSIREQMSASLKRVQELELEAKQIYALRQQLENLKKNNQLLQQQLNQQKEINGQLNTKEDLFRRINSLAASWTSSNELPSLLLPNIERVLNIKILSNNNTSFYIQKLSKEKSTQTQIKDSVDFLSSFQSKSRDLEVQTQLSYPPKVKRRNFGVTVRPIHHHFTQQITSNSIVKMVKPEEQLASLNQWFNLSETNRDFTGIYKEIISNFLENSYKISYDLFVDYLKHYSLSLKPTCREAFGQTDVKYLVDNSTQREISWENKLLQVEISHENKSINTDSKECVNGFCQSDISTCEHQTTQTFDLKTYSDICLDLSEGIISKISQKEVASMTESYLLEELIHERIEHSIELIHHELRTELSVKENPVELVDSFVGSEDVINYAEVGTESEFNMIFVDSSTQYDESVKIDQYPSNTLLTRSQINFVSFDSEWPQDRIEDTFKTLEHTLLIHSTEEHEDDNHSHQQNLQMVIEPQVDYHRQHQTQLHVDVNVRKDQFQLEITEPVVSTGIVMSNNQSINIPPKPDSLICQQMDEQTNEKPKDECCSSSLPVNISSTTIIKQDGDTPPVIPENVESACKMVTLWMNDSTTICSKDLNESLTTLSEFWFELTKNDAINLTYYLEYFAQYSKILKEKIVNMVDSNGNTCLHYAVSEGRWSIVRQILDSKSADVNKANKVGYTVLMLAAVTDIVDESTLRRLISESDVDKHSDNEIYQTVLMLAASRGKAPLVRLLLESGQVNINARDSDGSSALMCACENGHMDIVKLLLARPDCDTDIEDQAGNNAFKISLENSFKDIALLIFAKNNLNKGSMRSKKRSGSNSHPTSPLNPRKFK